MNQRHILHIDMITCFMDPAIIHTGISPSSFGLVSGQQQQLGMAKLHLQQQKCGKDVLLHMDSNCIRLPVPLPL